MNVWLMLLFLRFLENKFPYSKLHQFMVERNLIKSGGMAWCRVDSVLNVMNYRSMITDILTLLTTLNVINRKRFFSVSFQVSAK